MNPVDEGSNQFAELFKAMPAQRIGKMEDIGGAILYLSSQAGVCSTRVRDPGLTSWRLGLCGWSVLVCGWRPSSTC